jgi:hypothetical protein
MAAADDDYLITRITHDPNCSGDWQVSTGAPKYTSQKTV